MTKWLQRELERAVPAIAERKGPHREHRLGTVGLPSRPAAAHPQLHEALAARFNVATSDRQSRGTSIDVVHAVSQVGQVRDGFVDRAALLSHAHPFAAAVGQLSQDLPTGIAVVQQPQLPLAQAPRALFASEENGRRLPQLLDDVPETVPTHAISKTRD